MKRCFAVVIVIVVSFLVAASAQVTDMSGNYYDAYQLEPGLYHVGFDIPEGMWDVRFTGLNGICAILYSNTLDESGHPDLTNRFSYSFTYSSSDWWQGTYAVIHTLYYGYLEVLYNPCRIYEMDPS